MNTATSPTFTSVLDWKVQLLLEHIATIEQEVTALGGSKETITAMCEPYHKLLDSIYAEYPLAKALDASAASPPAEQVSIVGEVRELDLDLHRFGLRQLKAPGVGELQCVYRETADEEAVAWLNKQVKVSGTVVQNGDRYSQLLAVDSVLILN